MRKRKLLQLFLTVSHIVYAGVFVYFALTGAAGHGATITTVLKLILSVLFAFLAGMYASDATIAERRARNVK